MSSPGKKKSVVWNYFSKPEKNFTTCRLCNKSIKYFGGTTNQKQHLVRIHPTLKINLDASRLEVKTEDQEVFTKNGSNLDNFLYQLVPESSAPSVSSCQSGSSKKKTVIIKTKQSKCYGNKSVTELSDSKLAAIDLTLLTMIIKDYQPLSLVENQGFLNYSYGLQPLYKPPSKKRLTCDILPKHYAEAVLKLQTILNEIQYCAITTDVWTSDSNIAYLTVTSHFIYENKIHARVLATEELSELHTAEFINQLSKVLNDWHITNKIVAVVSDNEETIKEAVNDCLQKHHHPCVAHTLSLSVTDALSSVEPLVIILEKCRALVDHFKHSAVASEKLKTIQQQMGQPVLKVKQEVATRWNSCFFMIERLVQIKDALCVAVANIQNAPETLNAYEWKILEECIQVLKPVNDLTTILSAEKYPSVSAIIPLIRGFQYALRNTMIDTDVAENLKENLLDTVTIRLGGFETNKIVAKACFLDPRFKKVGFDLEENASNAQKWIMQELTELISSTVVVLEPSELEVQQPRSSTSTANSSDSDLWSHFDSKVAKETSFSTPSANVTLAIKQYLDIAPLHRKHDPIEFWTKHRPLFPEMCELAMKYLCIPATSIPTETIFSKIGQLTNSRRNQLEAKYLNQIVFLNSQF